MPQAAWARRNEHLASLLVDWPPLPTLRRALARRHVHRPPRADVGGELVVAVHHVERNAAACFRHFDAHVARLLAALGREPGAVVAPQARTLGALMRHPV